METPGVLLPTAFLLGVLHSLEPGHGKTVMTAYMIGRRVTTRGAFMLGLAVTTAHTFSVLLLAFVARLVSGQFEGPMAEPVFEMVGASVMMGIGVWMWFRSPEHHHDHLQVDGTVGDTHSLKETVTLGLLSGVVPCPEGVSLLMGSMAAGSMGRGVNVVVAFSVGIGVVVTACALLLSRFQDAASRWFIKFEHVAHVLPRISAAVITGVGAWFFIHGVMEVMK